MNLEILNVHPRDKNIVFDEKPHLYYINGKMDNISVTTYIHSLFPQFNADKIIEKMMKSSKWSDSEYYGKTPDEIKQLWNTAAKAGTNMHRSIELYYNDQSDENPSPEFKYFLCFHENIVLKNGLIPYRTEWGVYDTELKFAGSIDMVYKMKEENDVDLIIYDWKRCKQIKDNNQFETAYPPIGHVPNSNLWHYSLQLNIYKAILERNYGKNILEMYILWLHPSNKSYKTIKIPIMEKEINSIFSQRLLNIK